MDIVNRMYVNTAAAPDLSGVFVLPLDEPWFAHVLHVTFRNVNRATRGVRKPHVHDVYHIVLMSDNAGTFIVDGKPMFLERGGLVLTSPGEWHCFGKNVGESAEYCEITFEFRNRAGKVLTIPFHEVLSAWSGRRCEKIQVTQAGTALHQEIVSEIEQMARVGFTQERDYVLRLNQGLARVFMSLYTHLHSRPREGKKADPMQRVYEHIHKRFNEQLTLEGLAELAGVTPNYLSRRFKSRYGTTPITYQHRLRAQAAADLLRTTEHPIKRIATMVGFRDVYFFSRMFKKVRGLPPARYRKAALST
ncbi:MAG TPA: AraC family transcriptional regulator [Planctomycetota bacterium]|nr:AraC family transcriptional regulator [Planctomycetota bacterium]